MGNLVNSANVYIKTGTTKACERKSKKFSSAYAHVHPLLLDVKSCACAHALMPIFISRVKTFTIEYPP